jgi:NAD/NADP transhydrogenase beta subunit
MLHEAPQVLIALEQSGLAAAIRQSVWAYPVANVGHILALTLFAGAVAAMDARLLGAFAAAPPATIVRPARRAAMLGLFLMLLTGSALFTAEASHVAMNRVFQIKAALITLGVLNALLVGRALNAALADAPAFEPLPARIRLSALLSLIIWISVATCGRLIAYF